MLGLPTRSGGKLPAATKGTSHASCRTYYRREFAAGNCPPGLAKKNNGCLPPRQVNRPWAVGQSLPPEIIYQPMPRELWTQLTPPPPGYEYARVDDNIVLISTATRIIAGMLGNIGNFSD